MEYVTITQLRKVFDDELAKLSAGPSRDVTTPKFFANDNELRGCCMSTGTALRPFLRVDRDIEFGHIPRVLNLGHNDVIEVRVVERAKS
jgi:hypothetical protein